MPQGTPEVICRPDHREIDLEQLSSDKTLVVKPADKGGAIVIMDRTDYMEEAYRQLNDSDIYRVTSQNPLNSIAQKIKTLLEFHEQEGTIDNKLRTFLIKTDPITPIFYLLPNIHKQLFKPPGRPIILIIFLGPHQGTWRYSSSSLLATWHVSSLYTSITHEKGILAVDILLNETGTHIKIRRFCTDLLNLVLRDNYFMFEDTFYILQQGTAMGSHKDFVYTHPLFQTYSRIWRRYIDDIFSIWDGPIDSLISFDKHLNNVWPEFKFTLHYNMDRISFLDTLVCKKKDGETVSCITIVATLLLLKMPSPNRSFNGYNRIVSDETTKNTRLNEMQQKFSNRGYPQKTLSQARQTSVSNRANDNNKRIPFVSTFHPFSNINLDTVNSQICAIEKQLTSTMSQEAFQELKAQNQETLRTQRLDLEKKKRSKFLRDTEDYLQNRVYQWQEPHRAFRHQTSLRNSRGTLKRKTRRGGQCRRGLQKSHVDQITGTQPPLVINIYFKSMDTSQLTLLQKGLSFCPTYKFNSFELNMDLQRFFRKPSFTCPFLHSATIR
ncbi:unnamed protein product [Ranitomeya imitator]|uniref:Uncharacterized protein n=1 Tax=Ranitomeya imitator TaxID=111125 RepID=A0ABN9LB66_9NEOB|nr:unnamed protein product [Ranitomeya imitator]